MTRLRLWLGARCQELNWWLCDPHVDWSIEFKRPDGHTYGAVHRGPYSAARKHARLRRGRILGISLPRTHSENP